MNDTNPGRYILITPEGEQAPVSTNKVSLEKAQQLVEGYVEVVPLFNKYLGQSCTVLCNEEGKLNGLPRNNRATLEWYKCTVGIDNPDFLVGNVLVLLGRARNDWS